jgi:hypothetical protein
LLPTALRTCGALPPLAKLYIVAQLTLPITALATGSHRFAWMMYSRFVPPPEVFIQRSKGGQFERVDLVESLGHLRGEIDYDRVFVRELCRQRGARTVRLIQVDHAPSDHPC